MSSCRPCHPAAALPGRLLPIVVAVVLGVPAVGSADEPPSFVFPAGREEILGRMLGRGEALPDGCRLGGIRIDARSARAEYACSAGRTAVLELVHPSASTSAVAITPQFAIVDRGSGAAAALVQAIESRVRREMASWTWQTAGAAATPEVPPPPPQPVAPAEPEFTPDQQAAYDAAERLLKDGRAQEAFDRLKELARTNPSPSVLGLLVASAAAITDRPEKWEAAVADAEGNPTDPLANFIAGVSLHYFAHNWAYSRAEKTGYYSRAIQYLKRSLPAYEASPRVWIYLSVSYFRTGRQAEAEEAIEKAIAAAGQTRDADAWYCRGEIRHVKDPAGAVADLETYQRMMGENADQGAIHSASKDQRVQRMKERLERMAKGLEPPDEDDMFDPPAGRGSALLRRYATWIQVGGTLLLVAGVVALALWLRRRKARGR